MLFELWEDFVEENRFFHHHIRVGRRYVDLHQSKKRVRVLGGIFPRFIHPYDLRMIMGSIWLNEA